MFRNLQNYKPLLCLNEVGDLTHFQLKSNLFNGRSHFSVAEVAQVASLRCGRTLGVGFGKVHEDAATPNGIQQILGLLVRFCYLSRIGGLWGSNQYFSQTYLLRQTDPEGGIGVEVVIEVYAQDKN